MSYMIVYNKVFLKSPTGYTFIVLSGDNNVWESSRKRARDWDIWDLNIPADEMRSKYARLHKSDELFQSNGKWYGNDDLNRMIDNGIKKALSVEDFLKAANMMSLRARMTVICNDVPYGTSGHEVWECEKDIRSTEDFQEWVDSVKERKANGYPNETFYPNFSLSNNLKIKTQANLPGRVIAKNGKMYVSEVKDGRWMSSTSDIKGAKIWNSLDDAMEEIPHRFGITFIDADAALKRKEEAEFCLAAYKNDAFIGYIYKVTKRGFNYTGNRKSAHTYTKGAANQQVKKLEIRFGDGYKFVMEPVDGE